MPGESADAGGNEGPRVGLVLGAGGVLGGAWLVGALHAIVSETGWDPGSADYIVGTSAGVDDRARCWRAVCRRGSWSAIPRESDWRG
jgi:hypothetical protein